jgi:hypothetical protein
MLLLVFVLSEYFFSTSGATEQLSIQTLLAQAPSYELRLVTLRGVIREMQAMPPIPAMALKGCPVFYGQATFILEDDTGSLPVEVLAGCRPQAAATLLNDGEQVVLSAVIHISKGEMPMQVWAQASEIRPIPDATK